MFVKQLQLIWLFQDREEFADLKADEKESRETLAKLKVISRNMGSTVWESAVGSSGGVALLSTSSCIKCSGTTIGQGGRRLW